ncbi:MAG: hypothetical protein AAFX65_12795 [Cyanobacteria bacterium J06638_7]
MPPPRRFPAVVLSAALLAASLQAGLAQGGLMRPVLELMRPRLETRLSKACVDGLAGESAELTTQLQEPCRRLAGRASRCLVRETDAAGRELAVLAELLQGQLGPEGERVVKRCAAQLLGLPANSLEALSLAQMARRFGVSPP